MNTALKYDKTEAMLTGETDNQYVRNMILDSYKDMKEGKGRDYKQFFDELERRYKSIDV